MAGAVFDAAITPNLLPDEAAIEAAREEKRAEVADVMIRKNQKIVDEGEIITQEIYDRLVSCIWSAVPIIKAVCCRFWGAFCWLCCCLLRCIFSSYGAEDSLS